MILVLAKSQAFYGLVTSREVVRVDYHWFGRSVICPGIGCPACSFRSPKSYYYFSAVSEKQHRVVEACSSFYNCLSGMTLYQDSLGYRGAIIDANRSSTRSPWRVEERGRKQELCPAEDLWFVVNAVKDMYRLPDVGRKQGETPRGFLDRCAATQESVLRGCVIEGTHT